MNFVLTLLLSSSVFFHVSGIGTDPHTIRYDGDVNIGLLVNLHHRGQPSRGSRTRTRCAGAINTRVLQQTVAAKWAVDVINNRSLSDELKIGLQLHDTCDDDDLVENHLFDVISGTRDIIESSGPPLLGVVSLGSDSALREAAGALFAFDVPFISVTMGQQRLEERLLKQYDNLLTTVPDRAGQIKAMIEVALQRRFHSLSLISTDYDASKAFVAEASSKGLVVPRILELRPPVLGGLARQVRSFLAHTSSAPDAVALLSSGEEARTLAEELQFYRSEFGPITWLVCAVRSGVAPTTSWRRFFHGGIFVQSYMPELDDFRKYFVRTLQDRGHPLSDLIREYKEEVFQCSTDRGFNTFQMPCDHVPKSEIELRFQQDPYVSFVVKAISALVASFRLVQLDRCRGSAGGPLQGCLQRISEEDLHEDILGNLRKLSFSSMAADDSSSETKIGPDHRFSTEGRLVASKQQVYSIDADKGLKLIGWYTDNDGLRLASSPLPRQHRPPSTLALTTTTTTSTATVTSPTTTITATSSPPTTRIGRGPDRLLENDSRASFARAINNPPTERTIPRRRVENKAENFLSAGAPSTPIGEGQNTELQSIPVIPMETFVSRPWAMITIAVAVLGFFTAFFMLVYVSQKICSNTLVGSQAMGIILLIGVMCLFVSVLPWLMPPSVVACALRHILHPLLFVLCFAILLVKAMQLRSLMTIGYGGSVPQVNQLLSLLFMVIVQIVIVIEWYVAVKPIDVGQVDDYPTCQVTRVRFFLLHLYPCALMLLAFFYGVSVINFKPNYNEGRLIAFSLIFIIPVVTISLIVQNFASPLFRDAILAICIVLVAIILLVVVFFPKMFSIYREGKLATKRSSIYAQWPQWNVPASSSNKKTWSPNRWFQSYRPGGAFYRQPGYSELTRPFHTPPTSSESSGATFLRPAPAAFIPRPNRVMASTTSPGRVAQKRTTAAMSRPNTSRPKQPMSSYYKSRTSAAPVSYYYYGDHKSASGSTAGDSKRGKKKPPRKDQKLVSQQPCRCCSQGSRKIAQLKAEERSNNNNSNSSMPSLIEADCYPGTVIIAPDSESYREDSIWAHKYDTTGR